MIDIKEYMQQSREVRRSHLALSDGCDDRGLRYSYNLIALLAYMRDTTIPQKGDKAIVCHACNNPKCSNPTHLYWGSYSDNLLDQKEAGTYNSPHARAVAKYGKVAASDIAKANGKKGGMAVRNKRTTGGLSSGDDIGL